MVSNSLSYHLDNEEPFYIAHHYEEIRHFIEREDYLKPKELEQWLFIKQFISYDNPKEI